MTLNTTLRGPAGLIGVLTLIATPLHAGSKGFADKPGGGKNDPRVEVWVSVGPNQGGVVAPNDKSAGDVCGNYTFDSFSDEMVTQDEPPKLPPGNQGANHFLAIRFPFKIQSGKAKASLLCSDAPYASTSFLCPNVQITDESGVHIPGIATIAGKDASGVDRSNEPGFPIWLANDGTNKIVDKRVLTYVADDGDGALATVSSFAPGMDSTTSAKEIRVRLNKVAGIVINGFWVIQVDTVAPSALLVEQVAPTKDLGTLVDGAMAVSPKTDFLLDLTAPVTPMSMGVSKSWVKDWNKSHSGNKAKFHGNVGLFEHPQDDSPVFPNLVLLSNPGTDDEVTLPFNVDLVTPNNLAYYRIRPSGKLPKGPLELRALAISQNQNLNPAGGFVSSAFRTLYNTPFNGIGAFAVFSFHVGK